MFFLLYALKKLLSAFQNVFPQLKQDSMWTNCSYHVCSFLDKPESQMERHTFVLDNTFNTYTCYCTITDRKWLSTAYLHLVVEAGTSSRSVILWSDWKLFHCTTNVHHHISIGGLRKTGSEAEPSYHPTIHNVMVWHFTWLKTFTAHKDVKPKSFLITTDLITSINKLS